MEVFEIEPEKIKVRESVGRERQDMGDIQALAESFNRTRQILPIIVTRDYELIDGGRRLAACIVAKRKVLCVYQDVVDDAEMKELEIEANFYRKDLTPAEEVLAIKKLHELKQNRLGGTSPGVAGGHTIKDTAKILGKSKASIVSDLELAAMIEAFPELAKVTKKSDIKRAMQGMEKILAAVNGMESTEVIQSSGDKMYKITQGDALEHMKSMKKESVDIILTDPLYGIDADKTIQGIGGKVGGDLTTSGYKIEDDPRQAMQLVKALAIESDKFCKETSHAFIFCAPEFIHVVSGIFRSNGWVPYPRAFIWIKRSTGQSNQPSIWPVAAYESIVYLRRPKARLAVQGLPDWVQADPVMPAAKLHPYEKPLALLTELIRRIAIPGQILYDPFMGSGASIEAGVRYGLFCHGVDIDRFAFAAANKRMNDYDRTKDAEGLATELFAGTELEGKERKTILTGKVK
jgi:site-specific DNA-methyltransferase (adenine-specific)